MTLWRRVLSEKRKLVTVVVALLIMDLLLYVLAVYPLSASVTLAEVSTVAAETQLAEVRGAYELAIQANASKATADGELERFYADILPRNLAGARAILSPYLDQLATDSELVLERQSSVSGRERDSQLARLRTTLVLAGEYKDIRSFIYALETAPQFILIEEVILSQGNDSEEELVLTLGASTYYWAGSDATS